MLASIFTEIASGLGSFVPAFFEAFLSGFTTLFIQTGEAGALTLTPVGEVAIMFIVITMVYKIAPTVIGWLRLKMGRRGSKRRKARA